MKRPYVVSVRRSGRTLLTLRVPSLSLAISSLRKLRSLWPGFAVHLSRV